MAKWKKWTIGCSGLIILLIIIGISQVICISAWLHGMSTKHCPASTVLPELSVSIFDIRRGEESSISFNLYGHFLTNPYEFENSGQIWKFTEKLSIKAPNGEIKPIELSRTDDNPPHYFKFKMPIVDDGNYTFIMEASSFFGDATLEIPVELYANAIGHIITDRPIYEPGQQIKTRTLLLNARSLNPLENRQGVWKLIDPTGRVLSEKERQTMPWGVTAAEFYISDSAPTGSWTVGFYSGDFSITKNVTVEPFTLPRFSVTSTSSESFYRPGDTPSITGQATFSSGTPVQNAKVSAHWEMDRNISKWDPPLNWHSTDIIPKDLTTNQQGEFLLTLPKIPDDLVGSPVINLRFIVTDDTGESITHRSTVKLSEDPIRVDGLTEFQGLAEGVNNRLFVRVATPDNSPVRNSNILVKRAWDQTDGGIESETDENGVATIQLDPGSPINVVIPPLPFREPPPPKPVSYFSAVAWDSTSINMADILKLQQYESKLNDCTKYSTKPQHVPIALFISPSGSVLHGQTRNIISECLYEKLKSIKFTSTTSRIIDVRYKVQSSPYPLPTIKDWTQGSIIPGFALKRIKYEASTCFPKWESRPSSIDLVWYLKEGQISPTISINKKTGVTSSESNCILSKFKKIRMSEAATSPQMGGMKINFKPYHSPDTTGRPQATTYLGYELLVEAEGIGSSTLRLKSSQIPDIRIRTEPTIAKPGETVSIEILRGPNFTGELPKYLTMKHPDGTSTELLLDQETRKTAFQIPADNYGWYQTEFWSTYARIFVPKQDQLNITLSTPQNQYRPGDEVTLDIDVTQNEQPVEAAVGLFGVDKSLADLKPLPSPSSHTDALNDYAVSDNASEELGLSASMLQQGLLVGQNAQEAAMTFIQSIPTVADLESSQYLTGKTVHKTDEKIIDSFFIMLEELHHQARIWETNAQPHERFKPATVQSIWSKALKSCTSKGYDCTDLYGRELQLNMLPNHLLNMTEPKLLVVDGTRLPEDMVNWPNWVRENL